VKTLPLLDERFYEEEFSHRRSGDHKNI